MNKFDYIPDTKIGMVITLRRFLIWSFLLLGLMMIVYIAVNAAAATPPPADGDWNVNDITVIENRTVDLNGSLNVNNGGHLTLRNVTLTINCSFNGEYNITIKSGGTLICNDLDLDKLSTADMTLIRSNASAGSHRYGFRAENGSTLNITGTKITNCGWENIGGNRGVTVMCNNTIIQESIFTGNYMGIIYNGSTGGRLSNSNISGNSLNGAYLLNASNTTIERCNISGSNGHGVNLYRSHNNYIELNRISGFFHNQVFWPSYNGSAVLLDNSDHNTVDENYVDSPRARGFWLRSANYNEISNNYLEGNTYTNTMVSFGIGLLNSNSNSIHDNELHHHFMSIYINYFSHYNRVENNLINYTIRGLSLGDPVYGLWDAYRGKCDYNYFGNNTVNDSEFHGFIVIEGSSFNYIYNTTFSNARQRSQGGTIFAFLIDHADNNTFEDNHFYNNSIFSVGIGLQSSSDCIIANNTIGADGLNQEAVNLYGNCNRNLIYNNTIHDREWTISIGSSSNYNIIRNNSVYNSDYGIWVWTGSSNNRIFGNRVNNTTSPGISINYWSGSGVMERNTAENNTVWDCPVGIHSDANSRNFTIINNTIFNCTTGILIEGKWGHNISGGEIYLCHFGIKLDSTAKSSIFGSLIHDCQNSAVNITQCDNISVINSIFHSNALVMLIRNSTNLTVFSNDFHKNKISLDHDELSETMFRINDIHHQDTGLVLDASGNLSVENNTFRSNSIGVSYKGRRGSFKNNIFFGNTVGISYEGGLSAIANNTLHNNTNGISFLEEGANVEYCDLRDNNYGLHFSAAGRAKITRCIIMRNTFGIYAEYVQGVLLDQCTIRDNIGYGVYSTDLAGVTVKDSRLASNGGWGIFCIMEGRVEIEAMNNASIENEDIFISGYITVYDGGSLWVKGSHLRIAGAEGHYYSVEIGSGGFLSLRDSTVSSGNKQPYQFFARRDSTLELIDSSVTGCGIRTRSQPSDGWGVSLDNCSAILVRSSFRDTPCGIFIRDCNLSISEITFSETEHWAYITSSWVTFRNCTFVPSQSTNVFITFYDSQVSLENCSVPKSGFTMSAENNASVILTDTALDPKLMRTDISSTVIVRFGYVFHFVDPDGNPAPEVSYYITDGTGKVVHTGISDDNATSGIKYLVAFQGSVGDVYHDCNPHELTVGVVSPNGYQIHEFNVDGKGDLTITVNFYPLVNFSKDLELPEGGNLSGEFNLNDWFSDHGNLDYLCSNQGNLSVTIHPNGSVDIDIPDPDWYGVQRISFTATNRFHLRSTITINVTVLPVDDAPVILPIANISIEHGDTIIINLTILIHDVDTPFAFLNITLDSGLFNIQDHRLVIPYHELSEPVLVTMYVNDNLSAVNSSFRVFFRPYQKPVFHPLPNTTVEIEILYLINLSHYFNLTNDDLSNLTVSTSSDHISVQGHLLSLLYPEIMYFENVSVYFSINEREFTRKLNLTVTGHPVFGELPDTTVSSWTAYYLELDNYFVLSQRDLTRVNISVMSSFASMEGHTLKLFYPEDIGFERVVINYQLGTNSYLRIINITIEDPNHAPEMVDEYVSNEGIFYTFTVYTNDQDGQELSVRLVLNGNITFMDIDENTLGKFMVTLQMDPGEHFYYYSLDDGANETNSMVNTSVKVLEVRGEENVEVNENTLTEFLKSWPSTLLIIIIIIMAAILLSVLVFRAKKKERKKPSIESVEEPESEMDDRIIPEPEVVIRTEELETHETPEPEIPKLPILERADPVSAQPPSLESVPPTQMAPKSIGRDKSLKWLEKGMRFAVKGEKSKAEKSFNKSISLDPFDPNPWYQKCLLDQENGNTVEAEECMEKLLELIPDLIEFASENTPPVLDAMETSTAMVETLPAPISSDPPLNDKFSEQLPNEIFSVPLPNEFFSVPLPNEIFSAPLPPPDLAAVLPDTGIKVSNEVLPPPVDVPLPRSEEAEEQALSTVTETKFEGTEEAQNVGGEINVDTRNVENQLTAPPNTPDIIVETGVEALEAQQTISSPTTEPDNTVKKEIDLTEHESMPDADAELGTAVADEQENTALNVPGPDLPTEGPLNSETVKTEETDEDEELDALLSELNV